MKLFDKYTAVIDGLTASINAATAEIKERKTTGNYPKGSRKDKLLFALVIVTKHIKENTARLKTKSS